LRKGKINVSVYIKGYYGDLCDLLAIKNKANSKPIAGLLPEIYAIGIQSTKPEIRQMGAE